MVRIWNGTRRRGPARHPHPRIRRPRHCVEPGRRAAATDEAGLFFSRERTPLYRSPGMRPDALRIALQESCQRVMMTRAAAMIVVMAAGSRLTCCRALKCLNMALALSAEAAGRTAGCCGSARPGSGGGSSWVSARRCRRPGTPCPPAPASPARPTGTGPAARGVWRRSGRGSSQAPPGRCTPGTRRKSITTCTLPPNAPALPEYHRWRPVSGLRWATRSGCGSRSRPDWIAPGVVEGLNPWKDEGHSRLRDAPFPAPCRDSKPYNYDTDHHITHC